MGKKITSIEELLECFEKGVPMEVVRKSDGARAPVTPMTNEERAVMIKRKKESKKDKFQRTQ